MLQNYLYWVNRRAREGIKKMIKDIVKFMRNAKPRKGANSVICEYNLSDLPLSEVRKLDKYEGRWTWEVYNEKVIITLEKNERRSC